MPGEKKTRHRLGQAASVSAGEAERRRSKVGRILKIGLVAAALFAAVWSGGPRLVWNALTSFSYLQVSAVRIHGAGVIEPGRIKELAGIVENHASMLTVDQEVAARRILADPWISQATVKRDWLDMAVDITITENRPMALVNRRGDGGGPVLWYADARGDGFLPMKVGQDADYPVISGLDFLPDEQAKKEALTTIMALLKKAAHITKDATQKNLYLTTPAISEILVTPEKKLVLFLVDYPFPIFLGKDTEKQFKYLADALEKLYGSMKNLNITEIVAIELGYYGDERIRLVRENKKEVQRGDGHAG
jgi:cell division protein FtsQ